MYIHFKEIGNTERISSWKFKRLYNEIIKPTTSDNSLAPVLSYICNKKGVKFDGGCLKQIKVTFIDGTIGSIYIVHEIIFSDSNNSDLL